jgi:hypothetical protein
MIQPSQVIENWITTVNEEGRNLTKWELDFMDSISEQFATKQWLSDKQEEILERIYSEKTPL